MVTADSSPAAVLARTRLAQIARLVALQRAEDASLAAQPDRLIERAVSALVRDCLDLQVPPAALLAATNAACSLHAPTPPAGSA